ncbi:Two component response regulator, LuxR family [Lysobacter dokdonensis DS-58]|uniref:Two component response regulator, LuxR family n=1 Tax=Lysobacter dokdonensis DS-58 TaxID=1300345 RepID=A0A0A2WGI2_9GAMM|nr:response regulator transcription factor [Lysobacter dokdonensis]KGQ18898.1 Two component response regulator, LuxR family [Lysobacter dokdonensis DS-58]
MHRLVIADDHPIVFRALRDALTPAMRIVAECADATSAFAAVRAHTTNAHPVTLILDLHLPGDGIAVLQRLRTQRVPARVLVLSGEDERTGGLRALRAGADGYAPKTDTLADLTLAIDMVARGNRFFRHAVVAGVQGGPQDDDALLGSLSDREYGVLRGLAEGRTNGEIAFDLAMTPKSVSACRNKVMRKLGLDNLPALIAFARLNHITLD